MARHQGLCHFLAFVGVVMTGHRNQVDVGVLGHDAGYETFVAQIGHIEISSIEHGSHVTFATDRLCQQIGHIHAQGEVVRGNDGGVIFAGVHTFHGLVDENHFGASCLHFLEGASSCFTVQWNGHQQVGLEDRNGVQVSDLLGIVPIRIGFCDDFDIELRKSFFQALELFGGPVIAQPTHRNGHREVSGLDLGLLLWCDFQRGSQNAFLATLAITDHGVGQVIDLGQFQCFG